jgi:hypothetical protein
MRAVPSVTQPWPPTPAGSSLAVRGGSVRGGTRAAVLAIDGGKVAAEGAVLHARPVAGQADPAFNALSSGPGSTLALRRCQLPLPAELGSGMSCKSLVVQRGSKATAAGCTCGGAIQVTHGGVHPACLRRLGTQGCRRPRPPMSPPHTISPPPHPSR